MPGIDYRAVRASIRLAEVLELIAYEPRWRRGEVWRGPCPLHASRSATSRAFAVHLGKNLYHCFRCGAGGNALDLWASVTKQPLYQAALDLCQRLGRPVPWLWAHGENQTLFPANLDPGSGDKNMPAP